MFNDNLDTTSGVEMTEAVAMRLFDTLNGLKPKLGCGYFSEDHEADLIEASGLIQCPCFNIVPKHVELLFYPAIARLSGLKPR